MKIASVETFSTPEVAIVRVRTEDGAEGYGQVAPYFADISAMVLHRQVAPYAIGANADAIEDLADRVIIANHKFPGSYVCRALAGVDTALWDLRGKREGKSVHSLLGGSKARQKVYGSSMRRDITPENEAERLKRLQGEKGFEGFKFRLGNKFGRDVDAWPGRTEAIVPAVRAAVGDAATLLADANSGFSVARAIEVGKILEDNNLAHFEEPVPYMELEAVAEVVEALTIPVAMGEQECDIAQFRRMVWMRAVDIVQPDICYVGGISRAAEVGRIAAAGGLPCTPHAANLSMVTLFTLHLHGAMPNAGPYMEFSIEDAPWTEGLFVSDPFVVTDGEVAIPDGPGWGVEIAPEWLERADHRISAA